MVSMIGLVMKAANALGMWLAGIGLAVIGFQEGAALQGPSTQIGLKVMYCVFSGIVLLAGGLIFTRYPLTQDKYSRVKEMVEDTSLERNTQGLEKLL